MKESDNDIVHSMLNEESFNSDGGLPQNLLIKDNIIDNKENNQLIMGELSNKEKIFDALEYLNNKKKEEWKEAISLRNIHKTYLIGIEGIPALRGISLKVKYQANSLMLLLLLLFVVRRHLIDLENDLFYLIIQLF